MLPGTKLTGVLSRATEKTRASIKNGIGLVRVSYVEGMCFL